MEARRHFDEGTQMAHFCKNRRHGPYFTARSALKAGPGEPNRREEDPAGRRDPIGRARNRGSTEN